MILTDRLSPIVIGIISLLSTLVIVLAFNYKCKLYDGDNLVVGNVYNIGKAKVYDVDSNDPFKLHNGITIEPVTVIIEDKKNGYVKYCKLDDYIDTSHISFSETCIDFTNEINN